MDIRFISIIYFFIISASLCTYAQRDTIKPYPDIKYSINLQETKIQKPDMYTIDDALIKAPFLYLHKNSLNETKYFYKGLDYKYYRSYIDGSPLCNGYNSFFDISRLISSPLQILEIEDASSSLSYQTLPLNAFNFKTPENIGGYKTDISIVGSLFSGKAKVGHQGSYNSLFWQLNGMYITNNFYNLPDDLPVNTYNEGDIRSNSRSEVLSFFSKFGIKGKTSSIAASFLSTRSYNHIPPFIYSKKPLLLRNNDYFKNLAYVNYDLGLTKEIKLNGSFYFDNLRYDLRSYDDETFTTQRRDSSFTRANTDRMLGGRLNISYKHKYDEPLQLSVLYSNQMFNHNNNSIVKIVEAEDFSLSLRQDFSLGDFNPRIGLSYSIFSILTPEADNQSRNFSGVNGAAGFAYKLSPNFKMDLEGSRRLRNPLISEIINIDNSEPLMFASLIPETLYNIDAKLEYQALLILKTRLNLYYTRINDYILFYEDLFKLRASNVDNANLAGAGISIDYLNSLANLTLNYSYNLAKSMGESLPFRPKHIINMDLFKTYSFGFKWAAEISYTNDRFGLDINSKLIKLDDYLLINLMAAQNIFENYTIYFKVRNLLDTYYESEHGYPQPGMNLILGFNVNINT